MTSHLTTSDSTMKRYMAKASSCSTVLLNRNDAKSNAKEVHLSSFADPKHSSCHLTQNADPNLVLT